VSHQNSVTELKECVACGSHKLKLVLDLGKQPLANSFKLNRDDIQAEYPLAINHCEECFHVQLTHSVDPKLMFEDYLYVSGTAKTMHQHFKDFAKLTDYNVKTVVKPTVLDIGCNDGTQLDYYKKLDYRTFGVDPAKNLVEISSKDHLVFCNWFNEDFAREFLKTGIELDIITAQNVFAHGPDPLGFLKAAKMLMSNKTTLYIQTSQANMIKNNEFDTIYHEHISFFNTLSMKSLCERAGLHLFDVKFMPIHGTSYIFCISKEPREGNVISRMFAEAVDGLYENDTYVKYANRCNEVVKELVDEVSNYTRNDVGWLAVGYGAPAKGMTLLNYSGLKLDFIIDDNPLKQGRFTPGSSIPIYAADKLDEHKDAICFVPLAWNFFDEIVGKIKARRNNEYDKFVTYFPTVETKS
jgi:SAM-dependent methyltransferase